MTYLEGLLDLIVIIYTVFLMAFVIGPGVVA